jgi:hypothetical protein
LTTKADYISQWIDGLQIAPFDPTKKKKKKKVVIQDPADDSVEKLTEETENLSGI